MAAPDVRLLVARERKAQGLPPTITDPSALRLLAALVKGGGGDE